MSGVSFSLPFGGSFQNSNIKHDLIQMSDNIFAAYMQQGNGVDLGLLSLIKFENFKLENTVSAYPASILFNTPANSIRLFRLNNKDILIIRDSNAFVAEISANTSEIKASASNFFATGVNNLLPISTNYSNVNHIDGIYATNIVENELLVIENIATLSANNSPGIWNLSRVTYNPATFALNKTTVFSIDNTREIYVSAERFGAGCNVEIQPIPNTSRYFMSFSNTVGGMSSGPTPTLVFAAEISSNGTLINEFTIPNQSNTQHSSWVPKSATHVGNNTVMFHSTAGDKLIHQKSNVNSDIIPMTFPSDNNQTTPLIDKLIPVAENHYMIRYGHDQSSAFIRVIRNLSERISTINSARAVFQTANSTSFWAHKNSLMKWDEELFVGYGTISIVDNLINFKLYRILDN